jgi:hypothetical protein
MPLTTYTCAVIGGCDLFVPNSTDPSHFPSSLQPSPLGVSLAIPALQVPVNTDPGNAAIRITATAGSVTTTWYIWADAGQTHWVREGNFQNQFVGPPPANPRQFNVLDLGALLDFSIT